MDGLPEKIPIALLSAGINKLICILLAIAQNPKGLVLIDEIENGFYFDRLLPIWKLIHSFASDHEVQLFASTHSAECLRALIPVIEGNEKDFSLIRMINQEVPKGAGATALDLGLRVTNQIALESFRGRTLLAALRQHGEVR